MKHAPVADPALQGAQLSFLIVPVFFCAQPFEQGFCFQFWGFFQFLFHFRPVCFKWVGPGTITAWFFQVAGQLPKLFILPYCLAAAQVCFDCRLFLGLAVVAFFHDQPHLGVGRGHQLSLAQRV